MLKLCGKIKTEAERAIEIMRDALLGKINHKERFTGVFSYASRDRSGSDAQCVVCLVDLLGKKGLFFADHVYMLCGQMQATQVARYRKGDVLEFTAVSRGYLCEKAFLDDDVVHFGKCLDIKLHLASRIRVVNNVLDTDDGWFAHYSDTLIKEFNRAGCVPALGHKYRRVGHPHTRRLQAVLEATV